MALSLSVSLSLKMNIKNSFGIHFDGKKCMALQSKGFLLTEYVYSFIYLRKTFFLCVKNSTDHWFMVFNFLAEFYYTEIFLLIFHQRPVPEPNSETVLN